MLSCLIIIVIPNPLPILLFLALPSVTDKERLLKEVSIMLSFSHPNIMSLIGLCFDGDIPLLIMPFMTNGTVLEYVKQNRESLYFTHITKKVHHYCYYVTVK